MFAITLAKVITAEKPITGILAAKVRIKAAYQLSKIGKRFAAEAEAFNTARNKLIEDLGEPNAEGNFEIKANSANYADFQKQINELLAVELQIDLDPVRLETLGDNAEVAAADLMACDAFIVD